MTSTATITAPDAIHALQALRAPTGYRSTDDESMIVDVICELNRSEVADVKRLYSAIVLDSFTLEDTVRDIVARLA